MIFLQDSNFFLNKIQNSINFMKLPINLANKLLYLIFQEKPTI